MFTSELFQAYFIYFGITQIRKILHNLSYLAIMSSEIYNYARVYMSNEVIKFLKKEAEEKGFDVYESIYGEICLNEEKVIKQSSGAVYGIFVESNTSFQPNCKPFKAYPELYPVYWGKDITPVSRVKAHIQNHKNTGNINLGEIKAIAEKRLIFGAILVSRYQKFEAYLHETYPPLTGSSRKGRELKIIEVLN